MSPRSLGPLLGLLLCLPLSTVRAQAPVVAPPADPPRVPVRQAPPAKHGVKPAAKAEAKPAHAASKPSSPSPPTKPPEPERAAAESAAKPARPPDDPTKGSVTGRPLPRFASLRADEVNFRAGPGRRYPIEWLYKRRGLPVEIEREFEVWRLVAAPDGAKGWVHEATLMGRRAFLVTGAERVLRDRPQETGRAVAVLKPGVLGRIRACDAGSDWCRVQVGAYHGWLRRGDFWGALPNEVVAPG
ncbi:MAG TPA: SH3 domain-containing protein [Acetobacteraceae bacterium]|nr:SH3 domain-containing protein [Acetobacteraceae bacterium]